MDPELRAEIIYAAKKIVETTSEAELSALSDILSAIQSQDAKPGIPSKATFSTSGSVPSGAKSVTLITSPNFVGTILGDLARNDSAYTFFSRWWAV